MFVATRAGKIVGNQGRRICGNQGQRMLVATRAREFVATQANQCGLLPPSAVGLIELHLFFRRTRGPKELRPLTLATMKVGGSEGQENVCGNEGRTCLWQRRPNMLVATRAKKCLWQPGPKQFVATRACVDMTLFRDVHPDVKRDMYVACTVT